MAYEFTIVRLKKNSENTLHFPAELVSLPRNPIAGTFDEDTRARLVQAIALFPNSTPVPGIKCCFVIETLEGGRLEAWMTSDGHLFLESQAGLELMLDLFAHLRLACDDLAIEDVQHGLLHTRHSFTAWLQASDQQSAAA
jgi:hypothetical protein